MSDRPWLEDGDPSLKVERALLKRLNAQQPPVGSVEQGWAALAAELPVLPGPGVGHIDPTHAAHGLGHAAASGGIGIAAKIALGVALAGGAAWTGSALLKADDASTLQRPRQPSNVPSETPREAQWPIAEPTTEKSADVDRAPVRVQPQPRPASSATTLAEEGRLLAQAHQLVQSGQGQQALEVLHTSESRYPRSVLYQEREVLTIEALGVTGASGAAEQRAQRFLKRYPNSPHAGRLKRFVE
jgi:hypothetical protein